MNKLLKNSLIVTIKSSCLMLAISLASTSHAQVVTQTSLNLQSKPLVGSVDNGGDSINASTALVIELDSGKELYSKNSNIIRPIASITKLMTALVIARANLPMDERIMITEDDIDRLKNSGSRLTVGTSLTRQELLHLALMSSENRAAHALGRTYPGGLNAFVQEMNTMARSLGMSRSRFVEPTGLSPNNVSTPQDLVRLLKGVSKHPVIHRYTTSDDYSIVTNRGVKQRYRNTNRLARNPEWKIQISKTGFIRESGYNLVMLTEFENRPVAVVLLNANSHVTRFSDAIKVRHLVQQDYPNLF